MKLRSSRIMGRALGASGTAALLLAIGALGTAAPGQDAARPPQGKDQPRTTIAKEAKGKDDAPKKQDESKPAPVKLGLHDQRSEGVAGVHPDFPIRFLENVSFRHAGQSCAFVGDGLSSGTLRVSSSITAT